MIAYDKRLHLAVGAIIALATLWINPIVSMTLVVLAGIGKEVYDKVSRKGTPEVMDAVATVIGGTMVTTSYIVIVRLII